MSAPERTSPQQGPLVRLLAAVPPGLGRLPLWRVLRPRLSPVRPLLAPLTPPIPLTRPACHLAIAPCSDRERPSWQPPFATRFQSCPRRRWCSPP